MLDRRDQEILNLKFPTEPEQEDEYLLSIQSMLEDPAVLEELKREQMAEPHPLLVEAKRQIKTAINAASGMQKVIDQLHGPGADVKIASSEKEVKRALRRTFKTNKNEITFQMYKEAIQRMRLIADKIKEAVIDEQARGN